LKEEAWKTWANEQYIFLSVIYTYGFAGCFDNAAPTLAQRRRQEFPLALGQWPIVSDGLDSPLVSLPEKLEAIGTCRRLAMMDIRPSTEPSWLPPLFRIYLEA
jgi:hypothetical protein